MFTHSKTKMAVGFILLASTSFATQANQDIQDASQDYSDVTILFPGDLGAYHPGELYEPVSKHSAILRDRLTQDEQAEQQQNAALAEVEGFISELNPENENSASVIEEWQSLKPKLVEILQKQTEVEELLSYMTSLSRISLKHQDPLYVAQAETPSNESNAQQESADSDYQQRLKAQQACDEELLNNKQYVWPRCQP